MTKRHGYRRILATVMAAVLLAGVLPLTPFYLFPATAAETESTDDNDNNVVKKGDTDSGKTSVDDIDNVEEVNYDPDLLGNDWWLKVGLLSSSEDYTLLGSEKVFYDGLMSAASQFFEEPMCRSSNGVDYYIPYTVTAPKDLVDDKRDKEVFWFFYHSNPQFYFLKNRILTKLQKDGSRKYWMVVYPALCNIQEYDYLIQTDIDRTKATFDDILKAKIETINKYILEAVTLIRENIEEDNVTTPEGKARAVHDWLCWDLNYDYFAALSYTKNPEELSGIQRDYAIRKNNFLDEYSKTWSSRLSDSGKPLEDYTMSQSAVSAFVPRDIDYPLIDEECNELTEHGGKLKRAVCAGYAGAYQILCNLISEDGDIKAVRVASKDHEWNMLKIPSINEGQWFLVDTTWDDYGDRLDYPAEWHCGYQYFGRCYYDLSIREIDANDESHALSDMYNYLFRSMFDYGRVDSDPQPLYFMRHADPKGGEHAYGSGLLSQQEMEEEVKRFSPLKESVTPTAAVSLSRPTEPDSYTLSEDGQYLMSSYGVLYQSDPKGSYVIYSTTDRFYKAVIFYPISGFEKEIGEGDLPDYDEDEVTPAGAGVSSSGAKKSDTLAPEKQGDTKGTALVQASSQNTAQNVSVSGGSTPAAASGQSDSGTPAVSSSQSGGGTPAASSSGNGGGSSGSTSAKAAFSRGGAALGSGGASRASYTKTGKKAVAYSSCLKSSKGKEAVIPGRVKMFGKTYRVTSLEEGAFAGYAELKKITIGKHIKKIHPGAFADCAGLRQLVIRSGKLPPKVLRKALAATKVKQIAVPEEKAAAYKKAFRGTKMTVLALKSEKKQKNTKK